MAAPEANDPKKAALAGGDTVRISAAHELRPGEDVGGRYRIISLLGKGGMGLVYRVNQVFLNKEFALKTLDKSCMTEIAIRRFRQEARTAFSLDHPNIIAVKDFGVLDDQTPFLVMELLTGETLGERLKRNGCLTVEEAIPIFVQVCFALAYAHDSGVVHRDIKPNNIMLLKALPPGAEGSVKVLDFGIAKFVEHEGGEMQALTRTGEVFGSPLYMSPEQCKGGRVDHRADIYSLGCVFFEALTGAPPCVGENALATMMKHEAEPALTLKQASMGSDFPLALETIVATMLAKSPDDRYQNLGEVAHDLGALKRGDAISQTARSTYTAAVEQPRTVSMTSSSFYSLIGGVALLSAAIAGISVYFFHSLHGESAKVQSNATASAHQSPVPETPSSAHLPDLFEAAVEISDTDLKKRLAQSKADRRLALSNKRLTERSFKQIADASWIQNLSLYSCEIDNASLALLLKLHLTDVNLSQSNFDDLGASKLSGFRELKWLNADSTRLSNQGIAEICKIKSLASLDLSGLLITDQGLIGLAQLKDLSDLSLNRATQITNNGLAALEPTTLHRLDLESTPIDDNALPRIAKIKTLIRVRLCRTGVTTKGIENLIKSSSNLRTVAIQHCPNIVGAQLDKLQLKFPKIELVDQDPRNEEGPEVEQLRPEVAEADAKFKDILGAKDPHQLTALGRQDIPEFVNDRSLQRLEPFSQLQSIDLSQKKYITNSGLDIIFSLKNLRELRLDNTSIGDEVIPQLNQIKTLQHLGLGGTKITDKGLLNLSGDLPLERLDLNNMKITNVGMRMFSRFRHLGSLVLDDCHQIGDDGVSTLAGLPLETLSLNGTNISTGIIYMLEKTPSLKKLSLSNNKRVEGQLLLTMIQSKTVPKLSFLDVSDCPQIPEAVVEAFRKNRPNCKVLSGVRN